MMRHRTNKHKLDGLIALVLFGVFAACVLSVLLTGADVYRRLTERDREAYSRRTCVQYVATKVRQARSGSDIRVDNFDGVDRVSLVEEIEGDKYVTMVYCFDGYLRELFTFDDPEGEVFFPEDGEKIIEAQDMTASLDDGLLTVNITDGSGNESTITLSARGEGALS